jgi:DNA-binding NarL/FixJ family response regulator
VLSCLLKGSSNTEIADKLGLQVVTIKLHVRGIFRKLGAKNRTQAALKAKELGFEPVP